MKNYKLYNDIDIPSIGLGTYPLIGSQLHDTVRYAYEAGYSMIDTSDNYYNEEDVGIGVIKVINELKIRRDNFFLVTKVSDDLFPQGTIGAGSNMGKYFWKNSPEMQGFNAVKKILQKKINDSLQNLRTDHIDLYLMHWPYPDYFEEIWFEMIKQYNDGKVRSIGVCNCDIRHFNKLENAGLMKPMVNQIETSPINSKADLINYCDKQGIRTMVYSPLKNLQICAQRNDLHGKEYLTYINYLSLKYNKTREQIILKFNVQRGLIPIPKSSNQKRIKNNIDLFNFEILPEEMSKLLSFNRDIKYLPQSKSCPGL